MMQSNIFVKVEPLLRAKKFNIDYDAVIEFLGHYNKYNQWIYPDAMHRNLKINIKIIYEILELCVDAGMIEQYLQVYCPSCQRFTGRYYKRISEIPAEVICLHCDEEIETPLKHAIIIYRVL